MEHSSSVAPYYKMDWANEFNPSAKGLVRGVAVTALAAGLYLLFFHAGAGGDMESAAQYLKIGCIASGALLGLEYLHRVYTKIHDGDLDCTESIAAVVGEAIKTIFSPIFAIVSPILAIAGSDRGTTKYRFGCYMGRSSSKEFVKQWGLRVVAVLAAGAGVGLWFWAQAHGLQDPNIELAAKICFAATAISVVGDFYRSIRKYKALKEQDPQLSPWFGVKILTWELIKTIASPITVIVALFTAIIKSKNKAGYKFGWYMGKTQDHKFFTQWGLRVVSLLVAAGGIGLWCWAKAHGIQDPNIELAAKICFAATAISLLGDLWRSFNRYRKLKRESPDLSPMFGFKILGWEVLKTISAPISAIPLGITAFFAAVATAACIGVGGKCDTGGCGSGPIICCCDGGDCSACCRVCESGLEPSRTERVAPKDQSMDDSDSETEESTASVR